MGRFRIYLYASQITLFVGLIVCTVIMPDVAARNGGVSNYGNHLITLPLYVLAFGLNSLFFYLAARAVRGSGSQIRRVAQALKALSIGTAIVLLSTFPRHFSDVYSNIHDGLGIVLYGFYFLLSIWIVARKRTPVTVLFILIEAVGSLIGLLSALKVVQLLFVGQFIGAVGFGLLLCMALPRVIEEQTRQS